ncbi:MAG: phosphoribosylformylglycinamidine cyclo-ligase [Candidatus Pacebacteria bacterium]|nr:phosphoribosylformylglycinamidine cyclo-ligase [Candidatus Paceibacterota bacterium]
MTAQKNTSSYEKAGVNIDLAHSLLNAVKSKISATKRSEVLAPVGGFGGLFLLDLEKYSQPVLVSSIDGVGTKLMVAAMMQKYDSIGFDIVNHCINDIAVQGAEPLYFMDYLGIGELRSPLYEEVVGSIADACTEQGVALLGGETAEMPGMYGQDFDLVGCITGVVEKERLITGENIAPGHVIIGLASNGLHTNGFSLARKVLFEESQHTVDSSPEPLLDTVGEALLRPHTCYWPAIKRALAHVVPLHGVAHITGGGWVDNIKRVLPPDTAAVCDTTQVEVPPIMRLIQEEGTVDDREMYRVFNMGMGMAWFVSAGEAEGALEACHETGVAAKVIGEVVAGEQTVELQGIA